LAGQDGEHTLRCCQSIVDVKSRHSARNMACADELLDILKAWKQATQFADAEDWIFAGPVKLGRMPLSSITTSANQGPVAANLRRAHEKDCAKGLTST
jgi:hypothetical protein